jgi:hypothetical protein
MKGTAEEEVEDDTTKLVSGMKSDAAGFNPGPAPKEMLREFALGGRCYLKQKPKGVCLECVGCQQENEFGIGRERGGWTLDGSDSFYLDESATFLCRCCCANGRETKYALSQGGKAGAGAPFVEYARPFRCAVGPCKCCCFQEISVREAEGGPALGTVRERQFCCVVKYAIYDAAGTPRYDLHPPTCVNGHCVNCFDTDGGACCRVPLYLYPPGGGETERLGKITKVWLGLKKEFCTLANTYEIDMPLKATADDAALIFGAGLLVDHVRTAAARARAPNGAPRLERRVCVPGL